MAPSPKQDLRGPRVPVIYKRVPLPFRPITEGLPHEFPPVLVAYYALWEQHKVYLRGDWLA